MNDNTAVRSLVCRRRTLRSLTDDPQSVIRDILLEAAEHGEQRAEARTHISSEIAERWGQDHYDDGEAGAEDGGRLSGSSHDKLWVTRLSDKLWRSA